ncbi:hypothetical protein ACVOMV_31345 [Mesorhizobium atlanticum]
MNMMSGNGSLPAPTHPASEFLAYETECRSALKPLLAGLLDAARSRRMEPADRRLDADVPCRAAGVGHRDMSAKLSEIGSPPRRGPTDYVAMGFGLRELRLP